MQRQIAQINTDDAAHCIFDKNLVRHKFDIVCQNCHEPLEVAYHEEMLYSVLCPGCKKITLIKAGNPTAAARNAGGHLSENDRQRWAEFLGEEYKTTEPQTAAEKAPEPVEDKPRNLVPSSGSMKFHGPACDALRTMQEALRDTPCSIIISWEVEE